MKKSFFALVSVFFLLSFALAYVIFDSVNSGNAITGNVIIEFPRNDKVIYIAYFSILMIATAIFMTKSGEDSSIDSVVKEELSIPREEFSEEYLVIDTGAFTELYNKLCKNCDVEYSKPYKEDIKNHPLYRFLDAKSRHYTIILTSEVKKELEMQRDVKKHDDTGNLLTPPIITSIIYELLGEDKITEVECDTPSKDRKEIRWINKKAHSRRDEKNIRIGKGDMSVIEYARIFGADKNARVHVMSPDSDVKRIIEAYKLIQHLNVEYEKY